MTKPSSVSKLTDKMSSSSGQGMVIRPKSLSLAPIPPPIYLIGSSSVLTAGSSSGAVTSLMDSVARPSSSSSSATPNKPSKGIKMNISFPVDTP